MPFKSWPEITGEGDSPFSTNKLVEVESSIPTTKEAQELLEKANNPAQKLDETATIKAEEKYLKESNRELSILEYENAEKRPKKESVVEGYQIAHLADPDRVKQGGDGLAYEDGQLTEGNFPRVNNNDDRPPQDKRKISARSNGQPVIQNTIDKEFPPIKPWQDPLDPDLVKEQPGYPDEIEKEEKRKKGKPW